jgi:hypothetical protein
MSIICACLPVIYSLFRQEKSQGRTTAGGSSGWSSGKNPGLITFGSSPNKFKGSSKSSQYLTSELGVPESTYHAIAETTTDAETHSMEPLDPIRIRTEYAVR